MTTTLVVCPPWCTRVHNVEPFAFDSRTHQSAGTTVRLSGGERSVVRISLDRVDYFTPDSSEEDAPTLMLLELLPSVLRHDSETRVCAAVPVGSGLRFAKLLRIAADELTVASMFRDRGRDDEPDFSFWTKGLARESLAPPLGVRRCSGGDAAVAVVQFGETRYPGVTAVGGAAELREVAAAIEAEAAGLLDSAIL